MLTIVSLKVDAVTVFVRLEKCCRNLVKLFLLPWKTCVHALKAGNWKKEMRKKQWSYCKSGDFRCRCCCGVAFAVEIRSSGADIACNPLALFSLVFFCGFKGSICFLHLVTVWGRRLVPSVPTHSQKCSRLELFFHNGCVRFQSWAIWLHWRFNTAATELKAFMLLFLPLKEKKKKQSLLTFKI